MQFNNTTDKEKGMIQECESKTLLGDGAISGDSTLLAEFTRKINARYHRVVIRILQSMDNYDFDDPNHQDFPIVTTPLTTARHYTIPISEKVLKIKRMDITYDGSTYYRAYPIDVNEFPFGVGNDEDVDSNFSKTSPRYDLAYNAWWLYPRAEQADVDAGGQARIIWQRELDEFVVGDTTQEPGIPEAFHMLLPIGASIDWLSVHKPNNTTLIQMLQNEWNVLIDLLEQHYSTQEMDTPMTLGADMPNYA